MPEQDPKTFEASNGVAVFDNESLSCWVAPKPNVVYDELSSEDKKTFDAARFKEIDNLLKLGALSVTNSNNFAKTTPENIMPTFVLD